MQVECSQLRILSCEHKISHIPQKFNAIFDIVYAFALDEMFGCYRVFVGGRGWYPPLINPVLQPIQIDRCPFPRSAV